MTFYAKKSFNWRSLFDLAGDKESSAKSFSSPVLDDAAAILRNLNSEESVRPMLHGVLGVKIRSACLIQYDSVLHTNTNTFCAISVRSITRRTRVVQNIEGTLKWDQIKHFPVPIVRNRRHPYNLIKIVLHSFEANNPDHLTELGSVSFHMHDVMKASPIAGTYDLWNENVQVGDIDMELTFNYGRFGYGYSYQLEEEDATAEEVVQYSLLPRIIPPRDQREPDEAVMVVCATPHPKFIPFKEVVHLSYGKEIKEVLEEASEHAYKPSALVKEMGSFEKIRDTYYSMSDRVSRLTYLRNYLTTSTNQQETMVPKSDKEEQDQFPAKSYTQFAVPISALKSDGTIIQPPNSSIIGNAPSSNTRNITQRAGRSNTIASTATSSFTSQPQNVRGKVDYFDGDDE